MNYDPERAGAKCSICPLKEARFGQPVPPVLRSSSSILLIGQEPGKTEARTGVPFSGKAGQELDRLLHNSGLDRKGVSITNVVACCYDKKGGLEGLQKVIETRNAARKRTFEKRKKAALEKLKLDFPDLFKPKGSLEERRLRRERRDRLLFKEVGELELLPDPVTCCSGRLEAEVRRYRNVVALGRVASHVLFETNEALEEVRGTWGEWKKDPSVKIASTYNPAAILRKKHLRWVMLQDFKKALRSFRGELTWVDPDDEGRITYYPSIEDIRRFLFKQSPFPTIWIYDYEATKESPLTGTPKCLGIGCVSPIDGKVRGIVIPIHDAKTLRPMQSSSQWEVIREMVLRAYEDGRLWVGQNIGGYDIHLDRIWIGGIPRNRRDLLNFHRAHFPQLRHRLALIAGTLTDTPTWKVDINGNLLAESTDNMTLYKYNGKDLDSTGQSYVSLIQGDPSRDVPSIDNLGYLSPTAVDPSVSLHDIDAWMQDFCRELYQTGIWVNEKVRAEMEVACIAAAEEVKSQAILPSAWPEFNPNSTRDVAKLLYERFKVERISDEDTDTGLPGTKAGVIRRIIIDAIKPDPTVKLTKSQLNCLYGLYRYRRYTTKFLGTYIKPFGEDVCAKADEEGLPPVYNVWSDGRVRSRWSSTFTLVGRLSSSSPNHQNIPSVCKIMYQPEMDSEGRYIHGYAGCDMEQMHPRLFSTIFGVARLQEAFANGEDVYSVYASILYPKEWAAAQGNPHDFKKKPAKGSYADGLRKFAKIDLLSRAYGAGAPTRFEIMRKTEDETTGELVMAKLTLNDVHKLDIQIERSLPELQDGWARTVSRAKANGLKTGTDPWLADPLSGRRRWFHNGVESDRPGSDYTDCLNAETLMAEQTIMYLGSRVLREEFPFEFEGPGTGIFIQCHDQIGIEFKLPVPSKTPWGEPANVKRGKELQGRIVEIMGAFRFGSISFPAEGSWGFDLSKA